MRTDSTPAPRPKLYRYGNSVVSVAPDGDGEGRFMPVGPAIGRGRGIARMPKQMRAQLRRLPLASEL